MVNVASTACRRHRRRLALAMMTLVGLGQACAGDAVGPLDIDLTQSSISVEPGPYIAGDSYSARILLRRPTGEPFTGSVRLVAWLVGGSSVVDFYRVDGSSGLLLFEPQFVGDGSRLRVRVAGVGEMTSSQEIAVVAGRAHTFCTLTRGATQHVTLGATTTFTVIAADRWCNRTRTGGDVITLSLSPTTYAGGTLGHGTFGATVDRGDGTYTVTFTGTQVGSMYIETTLNGERTRGTTPGITVDPP